MPTTPTSSLLLLLVLLGTLTTTTTTYTYTSAAQGPPSTTSTSIGVLYSSSGVDKELQLELLKAVFVSLRDIDEDDLHPNFLNLAELSPSSVAEWVWSNHTSTLISLLSSQQLAQFTHIYGKLVNSRSGVPPPLKIFTPRQVDIAKSPYVVTLSLQVSQRGVCVALLNRVEKVGIRTLIPVLDSNSKGQMHLLNHFVAAGAQRLDKISFTSPIFIDKPQHLASFRNILDEHSSSGGKVVKGGSKVPKPQLGVLMLAEQGAQVAMQLAAEKNHMQVGWFSPNILEHEEWAYKSNSSGGSQVGLEGNSTKEQVSPYFGLYSVAFVGAGGWDNAKRRRVLRQLTTYTGASPRILSSVLAYDCATLAALNVRHSLHLPTTGLSGSISFDLKGHRRDGVFFGVSAVPDLASPTVTLLQPSTWILEDTISLVQTIEGQFLLKEYQVATSSLLTSAELRALANQSRVEVGCEEHLMNLITHDPFNQMSYNYYFKEVNLPESLLIPNQHGFGITFLCFHTKGTGGGPETQNMTTTLQIACTTGPKLSDAVKCYRSNVKLRERRSAQEADALPPTQYQYGLGGLMGDGIWSQPQNSKWSNPKEQEQNSYYYQTPTPHPFRRQDTSVAAVGSSNIATTPAAPPPTAGPTSKLPELRQILKAAKPFVGSCIGSTTGCAMCVLVLGRLPLGAVPAACTGPCFVGTFGSCGSLLGRVFSETTVICTELFRQGLMDTETFVADAEFGGEMMDKFPTTMQGYTLLATPLVEGMKKSPLVTQIISSLALPWAHHMKFLMGRSNEPNMLGLVVHTIGAPLCTLAGQLYSYRSNLEFFTQLILSALLALVLLNMSRARPYWKRWGMMK